MSTLSLKLPIDEIEFSYARSSGPGGQNVNKVNTKAILKWHIQKSSFVSEEIKKRIYTASENLINKNGWLIISCDTYRSQERNRSACFEKLANVIFQATQKPKIRKKRKVSFGDKVKRLDNKKRAGQKKLLRRRISD